MLCKGIGVDFATFCLLFWTAASEEYIAPVGNDARVSGRNISTSIIQFSDQDLPAASAKSVSLNGRILNHQAPSEWKQIEKWSGNDINGSPEADFCADRYVRGNCKGRQNPITCDQWEWTAYATIQNTAGIDKIRSVPEGLYLTPLPPTSIDGVYKYREMRVLLTVTCCTPVVQFVSETYGDLNYWKSCLVNVNDFQGLQSYEIGLIVAASLVILIVIITGVLFLLLRYKRGQEAKTLPRFRK